MFAVIWYGLLLILYYIFIIIISELFEKVFFPLNPFPVKSLFQYIRDEGKGTEIYKHNRNQSLDDSGYMSPARPPPALLPLTHTAATVNARNSEDTVRTLFLEWNSMNKYEKSLHYSFACTVMIITMRATCHFSL